MLVVKKSKKPHQTFGIGSADDAADPIIDVKRHDAGLLTDWNRGFFRTGF